MLGGVFKFTGAQAAARPRAPDLRLSLRGMMRPASAIRTLPLTGRLQNSDRDLRAARLNLKVPINKNLRADREHDTSSGLTCKRWSQLRTICAGSGRFTLVLRRQSRALPSPEHP